ncbi:MAG: radical SAM protein [Desulfobacterales bacterium]|nr:radical SAM protein [Desulfobacterales bacterium]MDD4072383.1 radical SAM protein [Desulfobacterales bacterium]MDD4392344.1 radical SAM protein [Desulfobacterales bacterium]
MQRFFYFAVSNLIFYEFVKLMPVERPFIIPIFIPEGGCPHQCAFCNQAAITGIKRHLLSPDKLRTLIDQFLQYRGPHRSSVQLSFYGGNFLGLDKNCMTSLLQTAAVYVDQGKVDSLRFSTRPDTVDEERLEILKEYPVKTIELGVQSMDDRVLEMSRRGHSAADSEQATALLKQRKYEIGLQMMVGLPGDDKDTCLATGQRIAALSPDFVRIYPTLVLQNSLLAIWYQKGQYVPLTLEQGISWVKPLYLLFREYGIKVIRMGLQPTDELSDGTTVLAGPYHPAFGHLVFSDVFLDMTLSQLASKADLTDPVVIHVHPGSIPKLRGHKNRNLREIKSRYHIETIHIVADPSLDESAVRVI